MEYSMYDEMMACDWLREKCRSDRYYAQNLYAAMCNMQWQKRDVWTILTDELWSVSWRRAGGIVAELCGQGDYLNWYCSGIEDVNGDAQDPNFYPGRHVREGTVAQRIAEDLGLLGWYPVEYKD